MIMIALAVWVLMITVSAPSGLPQQFKAEQAEFANQDDCEAYAKVKAADLLSMPRRSGRPITFPDGATAAHTCVVSPSNNIVAPTAF
jgi:hypothetical protein